MPQMAEKTSPDAPPNCAVVPYLYSGKNRLIYSRAAPYTRLSSTPMSGKLRYFSAKSSP